MGSWNTPEFFIYIDDEWWDVWVPDSSEWDGTQTVTTGTQSNPDGDNFSRAQLSEVNMSNTTWQGIASDYSDEFGGSLSQGRTDVYVEFRPRVSRATVGNVTIPLASDSSPSANRLRASQLTYGVKALPTRADTVDDNTTFGNAALVTDTLAELAEPIHVATLPMLMWPPTTLTTRPHQLRMGDAATVALPGFAQFFGTVAGLAWRLAVGHIPQLTAVVLETPDPPLPPPMTLNVLSLTLNVNRQATLTWTATTEPGIVEIELRWNIAGGNYTLIDNLAATASSHTFVVASIFNGQTLGAQVRAVNSVEAGEWSAIATVVAAGLPIAFPGNVMVEDVSGTQFRGDWDPVNVPGITGYRYGWRLNHTGSWTAATTTDTITPLITHGGSGGDTINFRVRVQTTGGNSSYATADGTVPAFTPNNSSVAFDVTVDVLGGAVYEGLWVGDLNGTDSLIAQAFNRVSPQGPNAASADLIVDVHPELFIGASFNTHSVGITRIGALWYVIDNSDNRVYIYEDDGTRRHT